MDHKERLHALSRIGGNVAAGELSMSSSTTILLRTAVLLSVATISKSFSGHLWIDTTEKVALCQYIVGRLVVRDWGAPAVPADYVK